MSLKALMDYTFVSKYARWIPEKKRRETWNEATDRVKEMMLNKYINHMPRLSDHSDQEHYDNILQEIEFAYEMMCKKRVLGSQRALQFGGKPIFKHNARMYNCLHVDTKFVTSEGVRSFNDFSDNEEILVLTHTGSWKNAKVKSYGEQNLNEITFIKNKSTFKVKATENHRWFLKDGTVTDQLKVGDNILKPVNTFGEFDFDSANIDEKAYWCYGYVYGDGTINGDYSMVRLCGKDVKYESRFTNLGFKSSSSSSLDADVMVYTGRYKKTTPDPSKDSPEMIRAFVAGYLAADGTKNRNNNGSLYINIQSSDIDHIEFIRKCFPIAGVWIISEKDLTGQETNYGIRPYTINFRISDSCGSKFNAGWKVSNIDRNISSEIVWCLEVEDDNSFIIPNGIVTGNCIVSYADRIRFFQECMYLLLCGCGTGFSVQKHHIDKLPDLLPGKSGSKKFVVEDTIEGWSDAVGVLVSSYFDQFLEEEVFCDYTGKNISFDFSSIRPAGSYLKSSGGKAPGPEPLKNALNNIRKVLDGAIKNGQKKIKPIQVYDIIMHAADAVISGGVRRSATICLFSPDDEEMAKAKTGTWFLDNPQRGRSNNSALLLRDKTSNEQFKELMQSVKEFGEPGFVWADSTELLVNPCVEIGMWPVDEKTKESGWQACNLSTINCAKIKTEKDFYDACRAAAIIGTLQAGFTSFPYLGKVSENIIKREALLGVSMTGIMEQHTICLSPEIQRNGAKIIKDTNKKIAELIGINQAARTTCIKPEGTSSCVLGTSSGIHPHHAKRYIRRVQANKLEPIYNYFKEKNKRACEESVWSNNDSDDVVSFCIEVPDGSKIKNKVDAIQLLEYVKSTQQNWVLPGTNKDLCTKPWLTHNVSNTINVRPEEWDEVEDYIYKNRKYFCGISLLPISGDKDYPQAPFTTVHLPSEQVAYYGDASLFVSGLIEVALTLWEDNLWAACDSILGVGEKIKGNGKKEFQKRCRKFANKYFDGDLKKLTYCMKDVFLWKEWVDLKRETVEIDYTECQETQNNVVPEQELACAGGACLI